MSEMERFSGPPSLASLGIEEIEANVCEDTFANRQALNDAKVPFRILEVGTIEVNYDLSAGLTKKHSSAYEAKKLILEDPRDPWSDYLPFDELPLDYMETAPAWIQRHLSKYQDALDEGLPPSKVPLLPVRCRRRRADGTRCWNWSWPAHRADGFCRYHCNKYAFDAMGQMQMLNDAARMRLSQMTEPSLQALEDLVLNSSVPHVRLKAATEVLDRVGIRGGTELQVSGQVTHEVVDPAQAVRDRLTALQERLTPPAELEAPAADADANGEILVVEAELVSDEPVE